MTTAEKAVIFYMGSVYNTHAVICAFNDIESHDISVDQLKKETDLSVLDLCAAINLLIMQGYITIVILTDLTIRFRFTASGLMKYYAMYRTNEGG